MDVNFKLLSQGGSEVNYFLTRDNYEGIERSGLQRALSQIRQTLAGQNPSYNIAAKITLAESYLKNGKFLAAERLLKEASESVNIADELDRRTSGHKTDEVLLSKSSHEGNQEFLYKTYKKETPVVDFLENKEIQLHGMITQIRQNLTRHSHNTTRQEDAALSQVTVAEAYLRSGKLTEAERIVEEMSQEVVLPKPQSQNAETEILLDSEKGNPVSNSSHDSKLIHFIEKGKQVFQHLFQ